MDMRLNKLRIENFKGIKTFEMELEGDNAVIKAENGVGKTTVYDAFLWLLFGKNSEGKKDFEVRPLDQNNQPIKGLVLAVEAEIDCDGTVHTFRKEHHEKVVRKQRGYETLCAIDEVPKKMGEYQDAITELIAEDTFKLLTDLDHFNGKLHWTKRREALLDIADSIGTPTGFDELMAALNGRVIKDYEGVLKKQKKRYEKERDEINPRMDEIQRGLDAYVGTDTKGIEQHRDKIKAEIAKLDKERLRLSQTEKKRYAQMEYTNELRSKKIQREAELKSDTSGVKALLDEKAKIEADVGGKRGLAAEVGNTLKSTQGNLIAAKSRHSILLASLNAIRAEHEAVNTPNCPTCKQAWPEGMKPDTTDIDERGNAKMDEALACKGKIAEYEKIQQKLTKLLTEAEANLQKAQEFKEVRFAQIDKGIESNETTPPEKDSLWQALCFDIRKAEKEIGEPVSEQLTEIDNKRDHERDSVADIDKALAHADRMKQDTTRIKELEEKEKQLAQSIADVEKQLADIDEYKATESRMIEKAVNGKFKHVTFKLFDQLLNGGLEECCEAILNGTPYSGMSFGEKILVGIDIINVLSVHYSVSVPLFIDHAESMTLPIETETQTIKLFAQSNTKELIVEREEYASRV